MQQGCTRVILHNEAKRRFCDNVASRLGISRQLDWLKLTSSTAKAYFKDASLFAELKAAYPEFVWREWDFFDCPKEFWSSTRNQRRYMDWLSEELNLCTQEDLYSIRLHQIEERGGTALLQQYYYALDHALRSIYPEYHWMQFGFVTRRRKTNTPEMQRTFFEFAAPKLGITKLDDWYKIQRKDIDKLVGHVKRDWNLAEALQQAYPEHDWKPWLFGTCPHGYWNDIRNLRKYFDWLADLMNVETLKDWYKIKAEDITRTGGGYIDTLFDSSIIKALHEIFPEYEWRNAPKGYFMSQANRRMHLDKFAKLTGIVMQDEWYDVTFETLIRHCGKQFMSGMSLSSIIETSYPEFTWYTWKFAVVPIGFWSEYSNRKKYFDWLREELGLLDPDDIYQIRSCTIAENSGRGFLAYYGSSVLRAIKDLYPELNVKPWLFARVADGYWDSAENLRDYFTSMTSLLGFTSLKQWESVSSELLRKYGASTLTRNGLVPALQKAFPEIEWDPKQFQQYSWGKAQAQLHHHVTTWMPDVPIYVDYKHPQLKYSDTQLNMELDIFVPSHSIAFEYQGHHHFTVSSVFSQHNNNGALILKDMEKKQACKNVGITLIEVPYWWDMDKESLLATIHLQRPDLVPDPGNAKPIPSTPTR